MKISKLVWFIFIGLIGFAGLTRWQNLSEEPLIMTDGQGYYAYLPALFIYQDPHFQFVDDINESYYPEGKRANYVVFSPDGNVNKYFSGTAVAQAPFFLVACAISSLVGVPVDGYSWPFQLMIGLAAIASVCLGLLFLGKLLVGLGITPNISAFTLVLILFGTNLFYYVIYEPSMSHAYTFCTVSGFLYFTRRSFNEVTKSNVVLAAAFLGLTALIRPTNGLIVLAIPAVTSGVFGTISLLERLLSKPRILAFSAFIFLAIVAIQPITYMLQIGSLMVWSYGEEGFNFLSPEVSNVLFSYRKGLFVYCPLLLVAVAGGIAGINRKKAGFTWLVVALSAFTWLISSWWMWYYGGSYGHRAFIDIYPLFAIGLTFALQYGLWFLGPKMVLILSLIFIPLQLVQTYQYQKHIIPFDNMSKEKFWNLFLRTGNDLAWYYSGYEGEDSYTGLDSVSVKHNMEEMLGWGNESQIISDAGMNASKAAKMSSEDSYGITLRKPVSEPNNTFNVIRISGNVKANSWTTDLSFVCSIEDSLGNGYYWKRYPLRPQFEGRNEWSAVTAVFKCGFPRSASDKVVIYPMKSDGATVLLDDFEITFVNAK